MQPWIEITISQEGDVTLEVKGAKGHECLSLTEFLEKGLGEVVGREMKTDAYESRQQAVQVEEVRNFSKNS